MNVTVGQKLVLTKDIYDDGEDHHPPGYITYKGDTVIVKDVHTKSLSVAHEDNPGSFKIYEGEFQT